MKSGTLHRTRSGLDSRHGTKVFRDSSTSVAAICGLICALPVYVGLRQNQHGTWNGTYQMNPILRRQTDVKQEFGKGGGGWGTGPNGMGYEQKRAEAGFLDKHRTRDLTPGQPKIYGKEH